jgi:hypothetical protein
LDEYPLSESTERDKGISDKQRAAKKPEVLLQPACTNALGKGLVVGVVFSEVDFHRIALSGSF